MSETVRVRVYDSVIEEWGNPGGMTWRWTAERCEKVERAARRNAPVFSGRLRSSIGSSVTPRGKSGCIGTVRASAPYALYVHEGTGLYGPYASPIYPSSSDYFVFSIFNWPTYEGRPRNLFRLPYTKGQRANPFLQLALIEVIEGPSFL